MDLIWFLALQFLLCPIIFTLNVYHLNHGEEVVLQPVKPLQVSDVFGLCYRFQDRWAQGDTWRIDLGDGGYYE